MELPIDHFRLLGVSPAIDAQSVLHTLQQRLDRPPTQGFTAEALEARAQLLRDSADLLADEKLRRRYEEELTAVIEGDPGLIPALVIPSSREVGGLILLLEAGLGAQAFELASRSLQPPRAPALGSGRESDLALLAGLASRQASEEDQQERQYERAAEMLLKGQQLLQRMGQHHALRQELAKERDALLPYRVLQLLSRTGIEERQEGMALLEKLVERRQGLDGDADPDFARPAFEAFLNQIRQYLTVQEQIDLFERWSDAGSVRAGVLTAMAMAASGFAQRKPQRIALAMTRLQNSEAKGLARPVAFLTLLLGQVEDAQAMVTALRDQPEPVALAEICQDCVQWLREEVLPGYRDVEIEADLDAWFCDRDVQEFIEQQDRRAGRLRNQQAQAESQATALTPPFLRPPTGPASAAGAAGPSADSPGAGDHDRGGEPAYEPAFERANDPASASEDALDHELDDGPFWGDEEEANQAWRWPELPSLSLPTLTWPSLSLPTLRAPAIQPWQWAAIAGGVAAAGTLCWLLRPKPQPLAVQPLNAAPSRPAAPRAGMPAASPPIEATTLPLRAPSPSEAQIRALLEGWLQAKAAVMAGQTPATPLSALADRRQIALLTSQRAEDERLGQTLAIKATLSALQLSPPASNSVAPPTQIQVLAQIRYSDERLDRRGRVLSTDAPRTLRNTYVFERSADGLWRLTDFRSGS